MRIYVAITALVAILGSVGASVFSEAKKAKSKDDVLTPREIRKKKKRKHWRNGLIIFTLLAMGVAALSFGVYRKGYKKGIEKGTADERAKLGRVVVPPTLHGGTNSIAPPYGYRPGVPFPHPGGSSQGGPSPGNPFLEVPISST